MIFYVADILSLIFVNRNHYVFMENFIFFIYWYISNELFILSCLKSCTIFCLSKGLLSVLGPLLIYFKNLHFLLPENFERGSLVLSIKRTRILTTGTAKIFRIYKSTESIANQVWLIILSYLRWFNYLRR